jgi:hypothetical protein
VLAERNVLDASYTDALASKVELSRDDLEVNIVRGAKRKLALAYRREDGVRYTFRDGTRECLLLSYCCIPPHL